MTADAWQALRPLLDGRPYLPWTEGSLDPAALRAVCDEIVLGDRRGILELGSGISTIVIGRLLAERGGALVSFEHDPGWIEFTNRQLQLEGLDTVTLVEAPLEPCEASLDGAPWYAADRLAMIPGGLDLLLVDGPPGYGAGMERSRYPAMDLLADRMAPTGLIILDDATREAETEILERWAEEHPDWTFGTNAAAGIAVGRRM